MIRAVYDTNILASGAVATRGTLLTVVGALKTPHVRLVTSSNVLEELRHTLEKPYFASQMTTSEVESYLTSIIRVADAVTITVTIQGIATHPEDDVILATAISGNAEYLVTGDKGLLSVGSYRGVTIVTPRDFLDILDSELRHTPASYT